MYRGYNITGLSVASFTNFRYYYKIGCEMYDAQKTQIQNINTIIRPDGVIDGSSLQANWFPQVSCDVFISHSHKDQKLAIALAGWLYSTFQLTSFIDSCLWGYISDLSKMIDDKYCLHDGSYDYNELQQSNAHIHMILNMALMQMIDGTECLFFLNTPRSLNLNDIGSSTCSPWIYSELGISKVIRRRTPHRFRSVQKSFSNMNESLVMKHKVSLSHLSKVTVSDLREWGECCHRIQKEALDYLYKHIR